MEVRIPTPEKHSPVFSYEFQDAAKLGFRQFPAALQSQRSQPNLGSTLASSNMDVRGFRMIGGVKEETQSIGPHHRWHG
jgi:hypothetical protein